MFTNTLIDELLLLIPPEQHYVGLLTTNPLLVHDPLTVEVVGPTYARAPGMGISGGTYTNTKELRWFGLPRGTRVEAVGVFDAPVNGNLLYVFRVGPHSYPKGGSYRLAAGGLAADPTGFTYVPPAPAYSEQARSDTGYTTGETLVSRFASDPGCTETYPVYPVQYEARPSLALTFSYSGNQFSFSWTKDNTDALATLTWAVVKKSNGCLELRSNGLQVSPSTYSYSSTISKTSSETWMFATAIGRNNDSLHKMAQIYNGAFIRP